MASGKLADEYLTNRPTEAALPQTLPGIKLKRPWGKLIKRYERLTGEKIPPDPDFPEEVEVTRLRKRNSQETGDSQSEIPPVAGSGGIRWSLAAALLALAFAVAVFVRGSLRRRWRKSTQFP
jgi:hypothetical protein